MDAPVVADLPASHAVTYPRFLWRGGRRSTPGPRHFYAWMTLLTALCLVGLHAWAVQLRDGMQVTGMSDHVSWGLYIANFTFMVGLAAGGVMMVIPAYLYHDDEMHEVVILGELVAIAAILMCLAFVTVDLGRPDRFWHLVPGIGRFNWPISMLTWDVIVLNGYLLLNLHITGYLLYKRFRGERPDKAWYVPFVYLSIVWAISIHTVTAFLYCGLGGRPFWNTALLAPRFLASAFVSGPAFIVVAMLIVRQVTGIRIGEGPVRTLVGIMRVTILISLLMVVSEAFTEFYAGGSHIASAHYLYFGLHGHDALAPWIWTSIGMMTCSATLLLTPRVIDHKLLPTTACVLAFVGVWIGKGMGLIVPGFIPSTLHELVEYQPSMAEWKITVGIWALGLMVLTLALRIAIPILTDQESATLTHGRRA